MPAKTVPLSTLGTEHSPEDSVNARYSQSARQPDTALCCAVSYDPRWLAAIPEEIILRDYGCGDPTPFIRPGDTVLDLGSGAGKQCYIAAQVVGPGGRVIGIDCNPDMLALARRHQQAVADRLGYGNVEFRAGMIQDLRLDLDLLTSELARRPVRDQQGWLQLRSLEETFRRDRPLVADESVDCLVSSCVLNLVRPADRPQLFAEAYRVLKNAGRAAICDIVADEDVPEHMRRDPRLWSGCISGAYREDLFLKAFEDAGFHGMQIVKRQVEPWKTVAGIEFRSITVLAHKGKLGPCLDRKQAVIYRGPFKRVEDDDSHVFQRGERMAVCDKTFQLLKREPYAGMFEAVEPREEVPLQTAPPFSCTSGALRQPRETKGAAATSEAEASCCGPSGSCC